MNDRPLSREIKVEIVDPLTGPDWDRLVLLHPEFNFFHNAAWAKVVHQTYGHRPIYLHLSQHAESAALVPLIEVLSPFTGRRGVCLPFSDLCGPLVFGENRLTLILGELDRLARHRKWNYFEIRGGNAFQESAATPATTYYGHHLDLRRGSEELFERFRQSTRGAIRKAERSNFDVRVLRTRDAVLQFYQLHVRTRRRHGLPPQPASFFLSIHQHVIDPKLGFVVLAERDSNPVAGAIFFHFGKRAVYKFAASEETHQEFRGNNLVIWKGIKSLVEQGAEKLHFGRTSLDNEGLRRFKLSWGAEEETINYYRFDIALETWVNARSTTAGFHNKLFRKLPLAVNRLAGAAIYPHLD